MTKRSRSESIASRRLSDRFNVALLMLLGIIALGCSSEKSTDTSEDRPDAADAPTEVAVAPENPAPMVEPHPQVIEAQPAEVMPEFQPMRMAPAAPGSTPRMQPMVVPQMSRFSESQPMSAQPQAAEPKSLQPQAVEVAPEPAPSEMQAIEPATEEVNADQTFDMVEVFYGTDRAVMVWPGGILPAKYHALLPAATCVLLGVAVALALTKFQQFLLAGLSFMAALSGAVVVGQEGWVQYQKYDRFLSSDSVVYGKEQGNLQLGTCQVSIPKSHQAGELESPSIVRLEFAENQTDHVMLMEVHSEEEQAFLDMLKQRVDESPDKDLLIFIHGYNVTFEDAARRTAQIAHDLEFKGVPVFYSWPSQGELLGYVTDRKNSFWTSSHLKEFLLKIHQHSGAQAVHLIAHSMGNRAFGAAVESLAKDLQQNQKIFNEVILAAPDVDARVFKDEIAPKLTSMAQHVTLYASQNDKALLASRAVNGYPRAGDVGAGLVVLNGIDTIDVTQIDTSLLGHAYYGDNTKVISDIYALMQKHRLPTQRAWLRDMTSPVGMYWYFDPQYTESLTRVPTSVPLR